MRVSLMDYIRIMVRISVILIKLPYVLERLAGTAVKIIGANIRVEMEEARLNERNLVPVTLIYHIIVTRIKRLKVKNK